MGGGIALEWLPRPCSRVSNIPSSLLRRITVARNLYLRMLVYTFLCLCSLLRSSGSPGFDSDLPRVLEFLLIPQLLLEAFTSHHPIPWPLKSPAIKGQRKGQSPPSTFPRYPPLILPYDAPPLAFKFSHIRFAQAGKIENRIS